MNEDLNQLLADLKACETGVWQALVDGDAKADAAALHSSFLVVYSDGFATKADHVQQLDAGPTIARFELADCRVMPLGSDHAVLSYKAVFRRPGRSADEAMYVSSIWQRHAAGWINVFSQDTPAIG